jgi:hypothetical protein
VTHPLDGIRAKLQRADENILNLNGEIGAFLTAEPKPYRVAGEHKDGGRKYAFVIYGEPLAPLRFAVLVGEIVHHLRSALDHLVCALVVGNGGAPSSNNQFPMARTADEFEQLCNSGLIKGVARTAKKRIRGQQPYHQREPLNSTLRVLHECSIIDKHRLLLVINTTAAIGQSLTLNPQEDGVAIIGLGDPTPKRVGKDGVEIFSVLFEQPAFKTTAYIDIAPDIVFDKLGTIEMVPVVPILTKMLRKVSAVVDEFEAEFGRAGHGSAPANI